MMTVAIHPGNGWMGHLLLVLAGIRHSNDIHRFHRS